MEREQEREPWVLAQLSLLTRLLPFSQESKSLPGQILVLRELGPGAGTSQ